MANKKSVKRKQNLSENYFGKLIQNLSDFVLVVNAEGKINYATPSVQKILGVKSEDLIGETAFRFVHPEDLPKVKDEYLELKANPDLLQKTNFRVVSPEGSIKYIHGFRQNLLNDPEIQGIILTVQDATEQFIVKQKLLQQQNLFTAVEKISNVGGWEWDVKTENMYWTKETYHIHGFKPEEIELGSPEHIKRSIECYSIDDQRRISNAFNDCVLKGIPYDLECRFTSASGKQMWIRTLGKPVYENNAVVKVIGNIVDITDKKREELLSEALLKLVDYSYNSSMDELIQKTLDEAERLTESKIGFFHFINDDRETLTLQVWSTNTLNTMCTAVGKGLHYNISEAGVWVECFHTRKPVVHNDYENLSHKKGMPEGHAKVVRELVIPIIRNEKVVAILGVGNKGSDYTERDINEITKLADWSWEIAERKRVEAKLKESEEKFRNAFDYSAIGIALVSPEGKWLKINSQVSQIIGYSEEELMQKTFQDITHPDDLDADLNYVQQMLEGEIKTYQMEKRYFHKSGKIVWALLAVSLIKDSDGNPLFFISQIKDITKRKQSEQKLIESENRIKAKLQSLLEPEGNIADLELEDIIDSNAVQSLMDEFYNLTELPVAILDLKGKVLVGTGWQNICTKFHRINNETLNNCIECDTVLALGVKPGTYKEYQCKNNLWDVVTPIHIGGVHMGNLFTGQFFYEDTPKEKDVFVKQAEKYGFDLNEYLTALEDVPIFSREKIKAVMAFYIKLAEMISLLSYSNIKLARTLSERENVLKFVEENSKQLELKNEELQKAKAATLNIIEDLSIEIEERKQIEEKLKKSEERFQFAAKATDDVIYDWNVAVKKGVFSQNYKMIFGYPVEEETSKDFIENIHPEDRAKTIAYTDSIIYGEGQAYNCEYRYKQSNGDYAYLFDRGFVLRDEIGKPLRLIGTLMDLTNQKEAEQQIRNSLKEKEILLKEVHHRVKNNLQIIMSLLNLQADLINNPNVLEVFRESQNRIRTMAIIHEQMYRSDDLVTINFDAYVQSIADYLRVSYTNIVDNVTVNIEMEKIYPEIDFLIPLGLIINELVSNAFKHAFKDRAEGIISIKLTRGAEGFYTLTISDNGIGTTIDLEEKKPKSLGLFLVKTLTQQIKGKLKINSSTSGTEFAISFYLNK